MGGWVVGWVGWLGWVAEPVFTSSRPHRMQRESRERAAGREGSHASCCYYYYYIGVGLAVSHAFLSTISPLSTIPPLTYRVRCPCLLDADWRLQSDVTPGIHCFGLGHPGTPIPGTRPSGAPGLVLPPTTTSTTSCSAVRPVFGPPPPSRPPQSKGGRRNVPLSWAAA